MTLATTALTLALAATVAAGEPVEPAPPTFAAEVGLVKLDVGVRRDGQPVVGLRAEDFDVRDDGVPQQIELVSREELALHAVLVLDTSSSVAGTKLQQLKAAALLFLDRLRPRDAASVVVFSHQIRVLPTPPQDHAQIAQLVNGLDAGGATALHDAVLAGLLRADPALGRPVVIVFSDGADRVSWLPSERVVRAARDLEATVYSVLTDNLLAEAATPDFPTAGGRGRTRSARNFEERLLIPGGGSTDATAGDVAGFLRALARETGGQAFCARGDALGATLQRILDEVRERYVLRYEPTGVKTSGWHELRVRLRKGLKGDVRTRRGYR